MATYDCFTFFNEIDLLKMRLHILYDYVDFFVLVELNKNHKGQEKPLFYIENKKMFEKYSDKIIYVSPEYVPQYSADDGWSIENYQRNCILYGLEKCKSDDIVMISDLDEIPNPDLFKNNINVHFGRKDVSLYENIKRYSYGIAHSKNKSFIRVQQGKINSLEELLLSHPVVLKQDLYYYYMNYKCNKNWYGTVVSRFDMMSLPQALRNSINILPYINNGGWHFSYMGGINSVKQKLSSIVEGNMVKRKLRNERDLGVYIKKCIDNGIDLYGRDGYRFEKKKTSEIGLSDIQKIEQEMPDYFLRG